MQVKRPTGAACNLMQGTEQGTARTLTRFTTAYTSLPTAYGIFLPKKTSIGTTTGPLASARKRGEGGTDGAQATRQCLLPSCHTSTSIVHNYHNMGSANEFPQCSICGYQLYGRPRYESSPIAWEPSLWQKTIVALIGPHEQYFTRRQDDLLSEQITEHAASPCDDAMGRLKLYHNGQKIHLQREFQSEDLFPDGPTGLHWCLGVHEACLTMASLVMRRSPTSQLRSLRDLWITLDRRCELTIRARTGPSLSHWLPLIPLPKRPDEERRRWGSYYIPDYHPGSYYNWVSTTNTGVSFHFTNSSLVA